MAKKIKMGLLVIVITVLFKVMPHLPNYSPLLVVTLYLGTAYSKKMAMGWTVVASLSADLVYAYLYGYSPLGSWTFFTVTGLLFMIELARKKEVLPEQFTFIGYALFASLSFWLWTNFGTWLSSGLYQQTLADFIRCYVLAIPFLENSLLATAGWATVLVMVRRLLTLYSRSLPASMRGKTQHRL